MSPLKSKSRSNIRTLIVIPSRYDSSRFPGKPLVRILGVSLVERVHRICRKVPGCHAVIATDDVRIRDHVHEFGGEVIMTRKDHPSGTDRVAEVAGKFATDVVINVQGDEPLLDPRVIQKLAEAMHRNKRLSMATLSHAISDWDEFQDSNSVKVVTDPKGDALYFSRSPIPFPRDDSRKVPPQSGRHIGIYAYRRAFLLKYVRWAQTPLEEIEKLEQLRAVERGVRIRVIPTLYHPIGVDVPADVKKVEKVLRGGKPL
jgi:3-deoxy-manno-octulosonate cytidylyltransferase (CMP-KDO synthetase)